MLRSLSNATNLHPSHARAVGLRSVWFLQLLACIIAPVPPDSPWRSPWTHQGRSSPNSFGPRCDVCRSAQPRRRGRRSPGESLGPEESCGRCIGQAAAEPGHVDIFLLVRESAARFAVGAYGPRQVESAVSSLSDEELAQLATRANRARTDFAADSLSDRDLIILLIAIAALSLIIVAVR